MFSHCQPREAAQASIEAHGQVRGQHPRRRGGREGAADWSGQVRGTANERPGLSDDLIADI